jgi:hypothetical protein
MPGHAEPFSVREFRPSTEGGAPVTGRDATSGSCGTEVPGQPRTRHADGGRTDDENHAEVCVDCHLKLHSP